MLELVKAALDQISQSIDGAVDGRLSFSVAAHRDHSLHPSEGQIASDHIAVVTLVGDHDLGFGTWFLLQRFIALVVRDFTARQADGNRQPDRVGSQMDLGRLATARAPNTLLMSPLFAPDAC